MDSRVLIVDDNEMMQSFLQHILISSFHVNMVYTGEEALDFLVRAPKLPHIVLADYDLETMSGLDLLKNIKGDKRYKDIEVVILSGKRANGEVCLDAGAAAHVVKPFVPANLQTLLLELVKPENLRKTG